MLALAYPRDIMTKAEIAALDAKVLKEPVPEVKCMRELKAFCLCGSGAGWCCDFACKIHSKSCPACGKKFYDFENPNKPKSPSKKRKETAPKVSSSSSISSSSSAAFKSAVPEAKEAKAGESDSEEPKRKKAKKSSKWVHCAHCDMRMDKEDDDNDPEECGECGWVCSQKNCVNKCEKGGEGHLYHMLAHL